MFFLLAESVSVQWIDIGHVQRLMYYLDRACPTERCYDSDDSTLINTRRREVSIREKSARKKNGDQTVHARFGSFRSCGARNASQMEFRIFVLKGQKEFASVGPISPHIFELSRTTQGFVPLFSFLGHGRNPSIKRHAYHCLELMLELCKMYGKLG